MSFCRAEPRCPSPERLPFDCEWGSRFLRKRRPHEKVGALISSGPTLMLAICIRRYHRWWLHKWSGPHDALLGGHECGDLASGCLVVALAALQAIFGPDFQTAHPERKELFKFLDGIRIFPRFGAPHISFACRRAAYSSATTSRFGDLWHLFGRDTLPNDRQADHVRHILGIDLTQ